MEPILVTVTEAVLEKMNKFYDSQMVPFDSDQLLLKAQTIGCSIEVNSNYIARFEGQNALNEAKHWSPTLARRIEKEKASNDFCIRPHIGAAETGSQDYIGPLCVVACYLTEEDVQFVKNFGIEDVNALSNKEIVKYAKQLKGHAVSSLLILDNSHYNKMIRDGYNQANIRSRLFNQAIVNVLQKVKMSVEFKVINQFVSPKTYFNYLKNEVIVVRDLMFETNADQQYMAVLAAEIISKYAYLQYFASMSKSLNMKLARGTTAAVDNIVVQIVQKHGDAILNKVVKTNFTNTKRVNNILNKQ
ncbi:MAG: ribonuclease HIII [Erysipelotrichaceae bacterium]|nr:ribonuclease HIII [Erysipelotrichaceae bacterium]